MSTEEEKEGTFAVPTGKKAPDVETAIGKLVEGQFSSHELNDILSSTELNAHEIYLFSMLFAMRTYEMIQQTTEKDVEIAPKDMKKILEHHLHQKSKLNKDLHAVIFNILDSQMYSFVLTRRSLKRKSRAEGVALGTASVRREQTAQDIGYAQAFATKIGISRKYDTRYIEKNR